MVRIGIAGCGSIARFRHAPEYAENENAFICGFFDPIKERAEQLAGRWGGKVYETYADMLGDSSIDAVSICTANNAHCEMSCKALEAGKHVLCEKPMAVNSQDAQKMVSTANKHQRFLMIGHNQRLHPTHQKAKELIDSHSLGRVLSIHSAFCHRGPEYWSVEKSNRTWFFDKSKAFVGALGDLGVHKIDLIQWLLSDEISRVFATLSVLDKRDSHGDFISVDDNARCIFYTKKGVLVTLNVSWTCYGSEENGTTIYCEGGVVKIFENPQFSIVVTRKDGDKEFYQTGDMQTNDHQINSGVINAFVNSVEKNVPPEISGKEGLKVVKVVEACVRSDKELRWIELMDQEESL